LFADQVLACLDELHDGFSSIWVPDHFHPPIPDSDKETAVLECMTTISFLATKYPRFNFGNMVLGQSYRNPGLLAKMAATLQILTKGKYILGDVTPEKWT
jgi:alkanesulfonate monooxygenase SsuD/methylene tetrahydromethanopterin reductase-like flavin-dependent oxidoreductase (luciferase family)